MNIIYVKEMKETCDIIKRIIIKVKKVLNIVKTEDINNNIVYYLPIFKESKLSKYRIKKLSNKISKLLEKNESNTIVLSEYLSKTKLLKNYLYTENINILDGRYLFKCLIYKTIEYIFKVRNKTMQFRGNFIIS